MTVHVKKCHHDSFEAIWDGRKPFEWRKEDDCRYEVGDVMLLLEYEPKERPRNSHSQDMEWIKAGYTGRTLKVVVTYVLRGAFDVPAGFAVLGIRVLPIEQPFNACTGMETR